VGQRPRMTKKKRLFACVRCGRQAGTERTRKKKKRRQPDAIFECPEKGKENLPDLVIETIATRTKW